MKYKASLDRTCKIMTAGVGVIILALILNGYREINDGPIDWGFVAGYGTAIIIFLVVVLVCYLIAPKAYSISDSGLVIESRGKKKEIAWSDIQSVRQVPNEEMTGLIRTFGVGGLFGYFGKFYHSKLGHLQLYATQRCHYILIETKQGKKLVLTPDDLSLANEVQQKLGK